MDTVFANRMNNTRKSFLREILKVAEDPRVISFAGGLPNPRFFPVEEIAAASTRVLQKSGQAALQYSSTEGYLPLREYLAQRYADTQGLRIDPEQILITNGSQQGLDLIGKIFLNKGDRIVLEQPAYLGAIQAFSLYEPVFQTVPLLDDGIDLEQLEQILQQGPVKLFYTVPNFQNPSGLTYSAAKRQAVADLLNRYRVPLVEDDPYGDLSFSGTGLPPVAAYAGDNVLLLGSFSKTVAPGIRLGWVCAKGEVMEKLIMAKQGADLHSNYLVQRIIYQYLQDNDLDRHLAKIRAAYQAQCELMMSQIDSLFPAGVQYVPPQGGMFLWLTLPAGLSSLELFQAAAELNVAFVPGQPFYLNGGGDNTLRLNFSNSDPDIITEGIKRLAAAAAKMLQKEQEHVLVH